MWLQIPMDDITQTIGHFIRTSILSVFTRPSI
jgi:hypothetical protein